MAETSRRFALTKMTNSRDRISDRGYRFTDADRDTIDRLLAHALENHVHDGSAAETGVDLAPASLTLSSSSGSLPSGAEVHYRYTLVDVAGSETAASPVTSTSVSGAVTNPTRPPALATDSTASTLTPGRYVYKFSYYAGTDPYETRPSPGAVLELHSSSSIQITLPALKSGADGWNIYRKGPTDSAFHYIGSTTSASYVDSGDTALARVEPRRNLSGSSSAIDIEIGAIPSGYTWKLYRTYRLDNWENSLLAHLPADTLIYTDAGLGTSPGYPATRSASVGGAPKIQLSDAANVDGSPPPGLIVSPVTYEWELENPDGYAPDFRVQELEWFLPTEIRVVLGVGDTASEFYVFQVYRYDADADEFVDMGSAFMSPGETQQSQDDLESFYPSIAQGTIMIPYVHVITSGPSYVRVILMGWGAHGSTTTTMEWS